MAVVGRCAGSIRDFGSYATADHYRVEASAKQTGTFGETDPDAGDVDHRKQHI